MGISAIRENLQNQYSKINPAGGDQNAFLQSLLSQVIGSTQTSNRSYDEIKRRFFEFKGPVSSINDMKTLAFLAAKGPKDLSVAELLALNGEDTKLSDLPKLAQEQGMSVKKFCTAFIDAAKNTTGNEGSELAASPVEAQPLERMDNLWRHVLNLNSQKSPVFEVVQESHELTAQLDKDNSKKLERKREDGKVAAKKQEQNSRESRELELAALEQQKHSISPYNYTQRRMEIKNQILNKSRQFSDLVA